MILTVIICAVVVLLHILMMSLVRSFCKEVLNKWNIQIAILFFIPPMSFIGGIAILIAVSIVFLIEGVRKSYAWFKEYFK